MGRRLPGRDGATRQLPDRSLPMDPCTARRWPLLRAGGKSPDARHVCSRVRSHRHGPQGGKPPRRTAPERPLPLCRRRARPIRSTNGQVLGWSTGRLCGSPAPGVHGTSGAAPLPAPPLERIPGCRRSTAGDSVLAVRVESAAWLDPPTRGLVAVRRRHTTCGDGGRTSRLARGHDRSSGAVPMPPRGNPDPRAHRIHPACSTSGPPHGRAVRLRQLREDSGPPPCPSVRGRGAGPRDRPPPDRAPGTRESVPVGPLVGHLACAQRGSRPTPA